MKRKNIECIKEKIKETIKHSPVPEDPMHSENTLKWVLKLKPDADISLQIAALGHDIERACPPRVKRENYRDYDSFKNAHAERSAQIISEMLKECNIDSIIRKKTVELIKKHETGGDPSSDILNYADSLSFFEVNLPLYYARNTKEETKKRFFWGLKRLPEHLVKVVEELRYKDRTLQALVNKWLAEFKQTS